MNLLVSYAHIQIDKLWLPVLEMYADSGLPLMIDSGAYSMVKSGRSIDHRAYMNFVLALSKGRPNVEYIQLDKPRDRNGTRANLQAEYAAGLKSMPVCVANADEAEFCDLVTNWNPRVCMAGGQNLDGDLFVAKTKHFYKVSGSVASIHALGFTRGSYTLQSAAYSFDSTSWLAPLKWGTIHFFDRINGIKALDYKKIKGKALASLPRAAREMLVMSGVTESDFRAPDAGRTYRSMTSFVSTDAWIRYAAMHEKAGKRFFFAAVKPWMLTQLIMTMKYQQRVGINWRALKQEMPILIDTLSKGVTDIKLVDRHLKMAIAKWNELAQ